MLKEYRVYVKDFKFGSGHYILSKSAKNAITADKRLNPYRENVTLKATLWKTGKDVSDLRLTSQAKKQMGIK